MYTAVAKLLLVVIHQAICQKVVFWIYITVMYEWPTGKLQKSKQFILTFSDTYRISYKCLPLPHLLLPYVILQIEKLTSGIVYRVREVGFGVLINLTHHSKKEHIGVH